MPWERLELSHLEFNAITVKLGKPAGDECASGEKRAWRGNPEKGCFEVHGTIVCHLPR
jgi:hypothetical protein